MDQNESNRLKNKFRDINPDEYLAFISTKGNLYEVDFPYLLREHPNLVVDCAEFTVRRKDDINKSVTATSTLDDDFVGAVNGFHEATQALMQSFSKEMVIDDYKRLLDHQEFFDKVQGHAIKTLDNYNVRLEKTRDPKEIAVIKALINAYSQVVSILYRIRGKFTDKALEGPMTLILKEDGTPIDLAEFRKKVDEIIKIAQVTIPARQIPEPRPKELTLVERLSQGKVPKLEGEQLKRFLFSWYANEYCQIEELYPVMNVASENYEQDREAVIKDVASMKKLISLYEDLLAKF